jgi:hypothetical protein
MGSRALTRWTTLIFGSALLAIAAGCHSNNSLNPTPTLTTETFNGTVGVGGTASQNFDVNYNLGYSDGSITVTSLTKVSDGSPANITIGVGFGQLAFDGSCTRSTTLSASAAVVGQAYPASSIFPAGGTYCFQVYDAGTVTEPLNWTVQLQHY